MMTSPASDLYHTFVLNCNNSRVRSDVYVLKRMSIVVFTVKITLSPVYSDTTQLNSTQLDVELS